MAIHTLPLILVCPGLLLLFLMAAYGGARVQRRWDRDGAESIGHVIGAATSLVGLMIAFTFSIALSRYESRRDLIVREASAVRNVVHRAESLPLPASHMIVVLTRDYLTTRIASESIAPATVPASIARAATVQLQERLWATAASHAADNGPLLDALTELFAAADSRASANAEQIPDWVFAIVIVMSAAISAILGLAAGTGGLVRRLALLIYLAVLALALTLILDLDRPVRGGVRVSHTPFLELLER